jgi:hypothetical protein
MAITDKEHAIAGRMRKMKVGRQVVRRKKKLFHILNYVEGFNGRNACDVCLHRLNFFEVCLFDLTLLDEFLPIC